MSSNGSDHVLVGRSYTRSRRMPRMFGRMPGRDGGYLWGGPYTSTQAITFAVLFLMVWQLPLFGWLGPWRWLIPFAAYFMRRARIESRTPAGWLGGFLAHLTAPSYGTHTGEPWRPSQPTWARPRIHIHHPDQLADSTAVTAVAEAVDEPELAPSVGQPSSVSIAEPAPRDPTAAASERYTASPLQQLLARARDDYDKAA